MKNYQFKTFSYKCRCGHDVKVFIDYGIPQENYKCRKCGEGIKRIEG